MWIELDNKLKKEFTFRNFREAFAFMMEVAMIAEKFDHHPDWSNSYNKVIIELCTHSKGSVITDKDRKLAEEIDKIGN